MLRVEGLELFGNLVALLDLGELLANIVHADRFVADLSDSVGRGGGIAGAGHAGDEVEEHTARQYQDDGAEKNARENLLPIVG